VALEAHRKVIVLATPAPVAIGIAADGAEEVVAHEQRAANVSSVRRREVKLRWFAGQVQVAVLPAQTLLK
jgi:hypothetical protein